MQGGASRSPSGVSPLEEILVAVALMLFGLGALGLLAWSCRSPHSSDRPVPLAQQIPLSFPLLSENETEGSAEEHTSMSHLRAVLSISRRVGSRRLFSVPSALTSAAHSTTAQPPPHLPEPAAIAVLQCLGAGTLAAVGCVDTQWYRTVRGLGVGVVWPRYAALWPRGLPQPTSFPRLLQALLDPAPCSRCGEEWHPLAPGAFPCVFHPGLCTPSSFMPVEYRWSCCGATGPAPGCTAMEGHVLPQAGKCRGDSANEM